jgi:NADPH2 dehydrogenase
MSKLFSEFKLKNLNLRNRIVMPPMCMYSANDSLANEWHQIHYGTRAVGGVGLIIVEATAVQPVGRISDHDLGLWNDDQKNAFEKIVKGVKDNGSSIAIQLAHAGRKSEVTNDQPIAPTSIAFSKEYREPKKMTTEDIKGVIKSFKESAKRAKAVGFDAIEIHGAHGYLINQFLSPLTNKRKDAYGGSLENRMRFLEEIIAEVKKEWPDEKVLMLRISADEYDEAGNSLEDMVTIVKRAKKLGVDLVNVSSGGVINKSVNSYYGYQIPLGEKIKTATEMPVLVGGLITDEKQGEEIIANNRADLVYYGRELLRNPYFPLIAAENLKENFKWPEAYERAK